MKKVKSVKRRVTWGFDPVTRVVPSAKRYKRSRAKSTFRKESGEWR